MIIHFGCKHTAAIWKGESVRKFKPVEEAALRKLQVLNVATSVSQLQLIPGLHAKKLSGKLKDFWSIRVNDQYRIIFVWSESPPEATQVQLTDYH